MGAGGRERGHGHSDGFLLLIFLFSPGPQPLGLQPTFRTAHTATLQAQSVLFGKALRFKLQSVSQYGYTLTESRIRHVNCAFYGFHRCFHSFTNTERHRGILCPKGIHPSTALLFLLSLITISNKNIALSTFLIDNF